MYALSVKWLFALGFYWLNSQMISRSSWFFLAADTGVLACSPNERKKTVNLSLNKCLNYDASKGICMAFKLVLGTSYIYMHTNIQLTI